ncbi:unnamed protein product [Protopolystoma xenopodis]|uniref:Uncharacterized protein n=1 Tax=Protopolystoma xenopodis TaxID=117903 RepID=A0A3S5A6S5_9PLAT|nr:unnamed protein product [Protopolystoma xenopodis]
MAYVGTCARLGSWGYDGRQYRTGLKWSRLWWGGAERGGSVTEALKKPEETFCCHHLVSLPCSSSLAGPLSLSVEPQPPNLVQL